MNTHYRKDETQGRMRLGYKEYWRKQRKARQCSSRVWGFKKRDAKRAGIEEKVF